jgi:hypothetical protein
MVGVAQLVERRSVAPNVAGSIPVSHPNFSINRAKIMKKLGLHSLAELIHYAIRSKILPPPSESEQRYYGFFALGHSFPHSIHGIRSLALSRA